MREINKILAKAHFKCNSFLNDAKKQHIIAETCLYEAVGNLPVFCKCGEPCYNVSIEKKLH